MTNSAIEVDDNTTAVMPFVKCYIGACIDHCLAEKQLSQNGLARISGVSKSNVSQLSNDQKKATIYYVERIAAGLGLTVAQFLAGQPVLDEVGA